MTNAEYYLKEGTDCGEFVIEFEKFALSKPEWEHLSKRGLLALFLEKQLEPTLTEDERVILRNLQGSKYEYTHIARTPKDLEENSDLYIFNTNNEVVCDNIICFDHLFQFIKERRRILNS